MLVLGRPTRCRHGDGADLAGTPVRPGRRQRRADRLGRLATRAIGANLHVAVVTVDTSGVPLDPGGLYSYDLQFRVGASTTTLKDEGLLEDRG